MQKCILVGIRYSVLFGAKTKGFHLSASQIEYENYKYELFDPKRMKLRERLFEWFTLSSLNNVHLKKSDDVYFKVVVMTSTELPEDNKIFLESMQKKYRDWLCLQYISPRKVSYGRAIYDAVGTDLEGGIACATVRLDDDDALFNDYATVLQDFIVPENDLNMIDFPLGYQVYMANNGSEFIGAAESTGPFSSRHEPAYAQSLSGLTIAA